MQGTHSFGRLFERNCISRPLVSILVTIFVAAVLQTACSSGSPRNLKLSAIERLTTLQGVKKKDDKAIQKAISHIQKSLAEGLWEDAAHLAPAPKGKRVFHEEHKAAKQLQPLVHSKKISEDIKNAALEALVILVAADSVLAGTALAEANAYAGTSKKVDHFIKKSTKALQKGGHLGNKKRYAKAIKAFEQAWHHAQLAIKHADEAPPAEPPAVSLTAEPSSMTLGETATLSWTSTNADDLTIDSGIGTVPASGSMRVSPTETTTYTITATSPEGKAIANVTVNVTDPIPTVGISAEPQTILLREPSTLTWTSTNADSVTINYGIGRVEPNGSILISPIETTIYTITATGIGGTATASVTVTVLYPPTVEISANPETILLGESSTLSWRSTNANSVSMDPGIGTVPASGSIRVSPTATTTYTITATGPNGTAHTHVTVNVTDPTPTVDISAAPQTIFLGESSTLTWHSIHAESCVIAPGIGRVDVHGSTSVSPPETMTYMITATGTGGTAISGITVHVEDPAASPTVRMSTSPSSIAQGGSSTLSWTSNNAQSAFIDHGIGVVPLGGSTPVSPSHTTTYTITIIGSAGVASAQAVVMVTGHPEHQPEGSFGAQYEDLVPLDATVEQYDPQRFSLITGLVQDLSHSLIEGVSITVHGHPEYGTASTDTNGRFSMPVEGGGTITLVYKKQGLVPAQRKVDVPWNDIAIAETIQMIAQDPIMTTLTFDGNLNTIVTHQSTRVVDDFGNRSCTMVFTGDNMAYLVDETGHDIQPLTTITTRATEYATPASMPAILPPTSAYTYCAELSVDGAQRVRFDKPVITWVDNFLGFVVGEIVPAGYYDRDRGVWMPSQNGIVVRLLDTDSDGTVDALDADGDSQPDDLDGNGSFSNEVAGLTDAGRYLPGATFWRVAVTHFTPYDYNWPINPSPDAIAPNPFGEPQMDQQQSEERDCKQYTNSYVEERSRIFHEDIPIPGTGMTLHYASNRVKGYRYNISIPASGETVPASLKRIIVKVNVAGRTLEQILEPLANQKTEMIWDGLDHLGRPVVGPTSVHVNLGYVYDMFYSSSASCKTWEEVFAQPGCETTGILARQETILWRKSDLRIHREAKGAGTIAEGWTLSTHHAISAVDPATLHKGDGTITRNNPSMIKAIAGNGTSGYSGDSGQAVDAQFSGPYSIAVDAAGNLYIADQWNGVIRKVDSNGIITTVAGGGSPPDGFGDNGPATQAQLNDPLGMTIDASGNLYIADSMNHVIRKVDRSGIITTVAGGGNPPDGFGDNGPAIEAALNRPSGVAVDAAGNLYIADTDHHCIRKVDPSGTITRVAGVIGPGVACPDCDDLPPASASLQGLRGYSGDGGPAIEAQLSYPKDVAIDALGNLYIADSDNNCIRKIDPSGIITTVAGDGSNWYPGDGVPATEAGINQPYGVAVDRSGNLYIADTFNASIRKVDANGIIVTAAGNGEMGYYMGDGGPATEARFCFPTGVAVDVQGNLYIADQYNERICKVALPSVFTSQMRVGDIAFAEGNGLGHIMSSSGRHKATIDLDTGVTLYGFSYDEDNRLVSITNRFGNQIRIDRAPSGRPTAIISPDGIRTALTIGVNNQLTRITYPDGNAYSFEYSTDGLMTAKIEPEGNRFEQAFDAQGRLTDLRDEEGGHWHYTRVVEDNGDMRTEVLTAEGNLTTYTDHTESTGAYTSTVTNATGAETLFARSADGMTETKSLACGMNLSVQYGIQSGHRFKYIKEMRESSPAGLEKTTMCEKRFQDRNLDGISDLMTETVTVNGKARTIVTDTLAAQTRITSPEERTIITLYDPATLQPKSRIKPGLHETIYAYDSRGRCTAVRTDARETTFTYDDKGYFASSTDSEGHTIAYIRDTMGRITGMHRPDGSFVGITYDGNGHITVLTNPLTIDHGFGYSRVNLKASYQSPVSGSYSYVYDRDRRLIQTNLPSGRQIHHIYDKTRLVQIQTPEQNIDLTYACSTKVESMTNGTDTITYGYDGKLVTSETLTGTLNQSLSYGYNNDFNLAIFTYAGDTHRYTYDDDGLLTSAGAFTIDRNAGNGLPESVSGGGMKLTRTFNGYGEVETENFAIQGSSLTDWRLTRDNAGRITAKTETVASVTSHSLYTFDAMGRLLTVTKDGSLVETYQYGLNGTRTYEANTLRGITGRRFDYSDEDHLLTAGDTMYQYNVDGFLTTKTKGTAVTTYAYATCGALLRVALPGGRLIEYAYDPLGRRVAKKVNGMTTEKYLWQGLTRLLAVYDGSDNLIMRFTYADGRIPLAMTQGGSTYYLAYDQVGSLSVVTDASGNVVKKIAYDSFGNIINDTAPSFQVPFGFAGGLNDRDTGLIRFGARDYDPDVGRWTAKDPLLFEGGDVDLYGYCLNNPVNFADPYGNKVFGASRPGSPRYVLTDILNDIEKLRSRNDSDTGIPYKFRLPGTSHPWQFQHSISLPCDTIIPMRYGPGGSPETSDNPGPTDPGILWDESFLDESPKGPGDNYSVPHGASMTISNVAASNITTDSATIRWTTNQPADSLVHYGPTTSHGSSEYDPSFTKNHSMHLTNLSWGTTYHFRVVSTNMGGFPDASEGHTFRTLSAIPEISLSITSPSDGIWIPKPDVRVKGTFVNASGHVTSVTVNGIEAGVYDNEFLVNHVPLEQGANIITAIATDTEGHTVEASIMVYAFAEDKYIRLTADNYASVSPLETTLRVEVPFDYIDVDLTYTGPGTAELIDQPDDTEYIIKITGEGIYDFVAKVTDTDGHSYTDTIGIVVFDPEGLDALLRAKWNGMKAALIAGDIESAANYFANGTPREMFRYNFNLLLDKLPEILPNMGQITLIRVEGNVAEYEMIATQDGEEYSFYVEFVEDRDGVWRLTFF